MTPVLLLLKNYFINLYRIVIPVVRFEINYSSVIIDDCLFRDFIYIFILNTIYNQNIIKMLEDWKYILVNQFVY